jgi:hypothetical protein
MKTPSPQPFELDLDDLVHPARAFEHPRDVIADAHLPVNEKRAVLASWASDACASGAGAAPRPWSLPKAAELAGRTIDRLGDQAANR